MTNVYERRSPQDLWQYLGTVSLRVVAEEAVREFRLLEAVRSARPMEYLIEEFCPRNARLLRV
jgi:hypothetical protein